MYRNIVRLCRAALVCALAGATLYAAPQLRLSVPASLERPVWVASGSNGPTDLTFQAYNAGDGQLTVTASGSASSWLTPQVGGQAPCPFDGVLVCRTIQVLFQTSGLPDGTYDGEVLIEAAGAVDAPQTVPIKVYVGGNVPQRIDLYVANVAGASDSFDFHTPQGAAPDAFAAGDGLTITSSNLGSFRFLHEHRVVGGFRPGMAVGPVQGSVSVTGSSFGADNRAVPVTMNVTSGPILGLSFPGGANLLSRILVADDPTMPEPGVRFEAAIGIPPAAVALQPFNRGLGDLTITAVEGVADDDGAWLTASDAGNGFLVVQAGIDGLAAGRYSGVVRVTSNAVNSPVELPVELVLIEGAAPISSYRGVVNGASFSPTQPLAPGTLVSLFGSQLAGQVAGAVETPLPIDLAGTQVMIGGIAAPLVFVAPGQINFQVPVELSPGGTTLRVVRDGVSGNEISAFIDTRSAAIFRSGVGEYGAIQNASRGFLLPIPADVGARTGRETIAARPGDILQIFGTGLGPVNPVVGSGMAAGSSPLSTASDVPVVSFSRTAFGPRERPQFVGLAPGFVGLFQVNVAVPSQAATDARTRVTFEYPDGRRSNTVEIAVQR